MVRSSYVSHISHIKKLHFEPLLVENSIVNSQMPHSVVLAEYLELGVLGINQNTLIFTFRGIRFNLLTETFKNRQITNYVLMHVWLRLGYIYKCLFFYTL